MLRPSLVPQRGHSPFLSTFEEPFLSYYSAFLIAFWLFSGLRTWEQQLA
jgi:hypothetical protein